MKRSILLLLTILYAGTAHAEEIMLPPKDLKAEWKDLEELKFSDWIIKEFRGWGIVADGGSKVFSFASDDGDRFELMVANLGYWTPEDKELQRQVFFVIYKTRFYRIEPTTNEERNLIEKLKDAAKRLTGEGVRDPKLLMSLAERLGSREPVFKQKANKPAHTTPDPP
jgi:hypothetical protein